MSRVVCDAASETVVTHGMPLSSISPSPLDGKLGAFAPFISRDACAWYRRAVGEGCQELDQAVARLKEEWLGKKRMLKERRGEGGEDDSPSGKFEEGEDEEEEEEEEEDDDDDNSVGSSDDNGDMSDVGTELTEAQVMAAKRRFMRAKRRLCQLREKFASMTTHGACAGVWYV